MQVFLRLYLVAYFAVLTAAVLVMWAGGILTRLPGVWVVVVLVLATALGVGLAAVSRGTRV